MDQPDSAETARLLEQARAGHADAIADLLDRHRPYLSRVIDLRLDARVRGRVDPSDVVQETQMEATRRLGEYLTRAPMPFRLWLRKLACDNLVETRRRHLGAARRSVERELALPERSSLLLARGLLAGSASTPSEQLARGEMAERVRQAVTQLSDTDREIVLLRNFEGLSNQEIASLLGLTPDTASRRYGRALMRLRELLLIAGLGEDHA